MTGMWGQLDYSTYRPNDHQGGVEWSIWLERCPLPSSVLQTHFTKNCMLCSGEWPSWEKEKCSWVKSYQAAVLCQNLQTSSDKAMIKMLQVNKEKNPSRARKESIRCSWRPIDYFLRILKNISAWLKDCFLEENIVGGTMPVWLFKVKRKISKARGLRNLVFCCCFGLAQFLKIDFHSFYLFICMSGWMNVVCRCSCRCISRKSKKQWTASVAHN